MLARAACLVLATCALLPACTGYSLPHTPPQFRRAQRAAVAVASDEVKVTIKKRAAVAEAAPEGTKSTVTVRVKPASERAAAATDADATAEVTTSIKVNKPAPKVEPPKPVAPPRPVEEEMLLNATQSANCTLILEALQLGANPNVRDPKGRTPLHFMAGVGLAPAVVLLIHFGAQLNARDEDGLTPLHMAAGYANARTLRVLVAAGADIELAGDRGTPLEVVKGLGEYQYNQVFGDKKKKKFNKKDEKLQKLKQCVDVLVEPEKVRADNNWEDLLEETLKVIAI